MEKLHTDSINRGDEANYARSRVRESAYFNK
jgi:hypothetical protein